MKRKTIAVQVNESLNINFETDTTYLLIKEFIDRGYQVIVYDFRTLHYLNGDLWVLAAVANVAENSYFMDNQRHLYNLKEAQIVLIRNEPPFDSNYLTTTYLLEQIVKDVLVLNPPRAIRDCPEKLFGLGYKEYLIPNIIFNTLNDHVWRFLQEHQQVVLKPLYNYGGHGVQLISSEAELRQAVKQYEMQEYIILQQYLPQVKMGDKRVLLLNGEVIGYYKKVPQEGDFRANQAQGGQVSPCDLTAADQKLIAQLIPAIKREKLFLVGLDILDGYLLECNVTCPTGLVMLNKMFNMRTEQLFVDQAIALV